MTETRTRKLLIAASACALAVGLTAGINAYAGDDDEDIEIKIATQAPAGTIWMNALEDMKKELKKKTKVSFVYYPGGALGDEKTIVQSMAKGSIGGGLFTGIGLGEVLPEVRILELPFFYENVDEIDKVKKELEPDLKKHFEEKG